MNKRVRIFFSYLFYAACTVYALYSLVTDSKLEFYSDQKIYFLLMIGFFSYLGAFFVYVAFKAIFYKSDKIIEQKEEIIKEVYDRPVRSRRISQDVKDKVWNRDGGKCVQCGSNENLEFDHIIPFSKGGANTYRNLQLLCESCNRSKSDKIG